ncbi:MAG: lactonase family protein [Acidobacteria bacterium]|nr:lactonase family protein [Acidobacteriota bacterium]
MLPVGDDGRLEAASQIVTHTGELGPNRARQEAPHAHMAMPDATGRFVLVNDLSLDRTFVYRLDRAERQLYATSAPGVAQPGDGPRHLAFHPNGRFLYVINELSNTVAAWTWDAETGGMQRIQTISTLPDWYRGINTTAQILVSADGRFVYASNRGHDSIAVFRCDAQTGRLTEVSRHWTLGETPRNFNIDPSGRFMYVAHQNTDNLVVFKIDSATGMLEFTGHTFLSPGQPVCIVFHSEPLAGNSATGNVTFAATQNPVIPGSNGAAQVTLGWNAPGAEEVELRIGAPNGVNMGRDASWGTATTGQWVTDGMTFFLQDVSGGKPLTAANTLATVRVHHRK